MIFSLLHHRRQPLLQFGQYTRSLTHAVLPSVWPLCDTILKLIASDNLEYKELT